MGGSTWLGIRPTKPFGIMRRGQLNFNAYGVANTSGLLVGNGGNINANGQFRNFWFGYMGAGVNNIVTAYSDRDARGGPAVYRPRGMQMWIGVEGDSRKSIAPTFNAGGGRRLDGLGSGWDLSTGAQFRVGGQLNGSVNLGYGRNIDDQQWLGNFTDSTATTAYTFARLYQSTSSLTLRLNYTITPTLSFESYLQPFVSVGEYTDWRALTNGRARERNERFRPYADRGAPDGFRFGQLRTNNVVRWEYRPGSVLFFVWTQGRDTFTDEPGLGGVQPGFDALLSQRPQNVFLVKASYWLGR